MIIIPKEKPVLSGLNSYYLKIEKLVEHFQGQIGTGAIFFRSQTVQAIIFFDQDNILNVYFQNKTKSLQGKEALNTLSKAAYNFIVEIYELDPDRIHFWANMPAAQQIHQGLSTEFVDFDVLLKKMTGEKFTGFFDVKLNQDLGEGLLFFDGGELIGGSYHLAETTDSDPHEQQLTLIRHIKKEGAIFHVSTLVLKKEETTFAYKEASQASSFDLLQALGEMLNTFEGIVKKEKAYDFNVLLKQKFVDKALKYDFLDPFAAEFFYEGGKVIFTGREEHRVVAKGVIEAVLELADDLDKREHLLQRLHIWRKKYGNRFSELGLRV
ncbi:MAG: hypothetical protein J7L69_09055 [Desulfobulbaceae bacterium]|nr:hypothetical protein [Desulfobulbaceae bacterium]